MMRRSNDGYDDGYYDHDEENDENDDDDEEWDNDDPNAKEEEGLSPSNGLYNTTKISRLSDPN